MDAEALAHVLRQVLPSSARVSSGESDRDLHAADMTVHRPRRPDVVVYPTSTKEVAQVLRLADRERVPVTPFGAGSSLEGHIIPLSGGISLDLSGLDRIWRSSRRT